MVGNRTAKIEKRKGKIENRFVCSLFFLLSFLFSLLITASASVQPAVVAGHSTLAGWNDDKSIELQYVDDTLFEDDALYQELVAVDRACSFYKPIGNFTRGWIIALDARSMPIDYFRYQFNDQWYSLAYLPETRAGRAIMVSQDAEYTLFTDMVRNCTALIMLVRDRDGRYHRLLAQFYEPLSQVQRLIDRLTDRGYTAVQAVYLPREDTFGNNEAIARLREFCNEHLRIVMRKRSISSAHIMVKQDGFLIRDVAEDTSILGSLPAMQPDDTTLKAA